MDGGIKTGLGFNDGRLVHFEGVDDERVPQGCENRKRNAESDLSPGVQLC
jgi:hypothetical protein